MPSKHARKKPVKAQGLKKAAAKQATSKLSTQKGKHATQGKENHPSRMAAPISTASSVLTSAPISVSTDGKGMSIHYCLLLLTMLTGHSATVSNVPESPRDTSTLMTLPHEDVLDAEVRILRGKYIYIFVHILLIFSFFFSIFFFLAWIAQMNNELRAAQGAAAGGSTTEDARVECPKKIKNLEVAMSLSNHSTYRGFCVSPSSFLLSVSELNIIFIIEQHKEIRRDSGVQF